MQFCGKSEEVSISDIIYIIYIHNVLYHTLYFLIFLLKERQALMMTCPICKSVMMPSSMEMHERYHRQLEQNKDEETSVILIERTKRKAAEK